MICRKHSYGTDGRNGNYCPYCRIEKLEQQVTAVYSYLEDALLVHVPLPRTAIELMIKTKEVLEND